MSLTKRTTSDAYNFRQRNPVYLKEDLYCPICLDIFIKPIKLFCNHEMCLKCFKSLIKYSKRCPICRRNITNFFIVHFNLFLNHQKWNFIKTRFSSKSKKRIEKLYNQDRRGFSIFYELYQHYFFLKMIMIFIFGTLFICFYIKYICI